MCRQIYHAHGSYRWWYNDCMPTILCQGIKKLYMYMVCLFLKYFPCNPYRSMEINRIFTYIVLHEWWIFIGFSGGVTY